MKPYPLISAIGLSILMAGVTLPAMAAQVNITIGIAPPPVRYEPAPVLQPGYVYAPGYWGWSGSQYVWIRGRPMVQREGYRWVPDNWDQRNGSYVRRVGRWETDPGYRVVKVKEKKWKGDKHNGNHDNGRGKNGHDNGKGQGKGHRD